MKKIGSLCVYCGSRPGDDPIFLEAARELGRTVAQSDVRLVYGGGGVGLMGETARAARDAGGEVLGIIPEFLVGLEGTVEGIEERIVNDMHERKMMMFDESDAFCVLPGGIGTLEEIIELLSWAQLKLHGKPMILADVAGYWSPLKDLLEHIVERGFAARELNGRYAVVETIAQVLTQAEKMRIDHVV